MSSKGIAIRGAKKKSLIKRAKNDQIDVVDLPQHAGF